MNKYLEIDEWKVVEKGFDPARQRASESIFSLGNGHMGQRANFEESYSGDSLQGSYIGGIYYPDKTKVGWWKNGYPEYFAKVLNSVNWIGINLWVNGRELDLATCKVSAFNRVLNMKEGYLLRRFTVAFGNGDKIQVATKRFLSMSRHEVGMVNYSVKALNFNGNITFEPYLDADVENEDANYDEKFWLPIDQETFDNGGLVTTKTKKLNLHVCAAMQCSFLKDEQPLTLNGSPEAQTQSIKQRYEVSVDKDETITLQKYAVVASSFNHERKRLHSHTRQQLKDVVTVGYEALLNEQAQWWENKWEQSDILIEGDKAAQQGIRFNIFQLYQTYTGDDERLNIGPKGFTGEKYGGSTYWDTEAYCLPFYMCTAGSEVARNLLLYRYKHLPKAIENAQKLGFTNGAALYPMVTMNGEECHNEWEITFEEIHRNGIIAYAIYNYIRHTGDSSYLQEGGLEVLIGIARFWDQRFHYSEERQKYVMHGVTGPNEYENNVNNNWYTSYIAIWCLKYTQDCIKQIQNHSPEAFEEIKDATDFSSDEIDQWNAIIDEVYLPVDDERGIFVQQDGYLDKQQQLAADLPSDVRPLNQHWSWDRILRSCFIKQADVLQGLYLFEQKFDEATLRNNFDFYEPRTVHESSLSPCIHSILASKLGYQERAYELYLRTARLDLDDYNQEVHQGLHITSMAGTWMSIVEGFAGKRIKDGQLHFAPLLPERWQSFTFKIVYRKRLIKIRIGRQQTQVEIAKGEALDCYLYGEKYHIDPDKPVTISTQANKEPTTQLKN